MNSPLHWPAWIIDVYMSMFPSFEPLKDKFQLI